MCLMGNMELLSMQCRGIRTHFAARGKFPAFTRVAVGTWGAFSSYGGWPLKTRVYSVTSGLLSSYVGHFRNLHEAWQGNTDASRGEAEDQAFLSSCHSDIGIPINFQEESGIITF